MDMVAFYKQMLLNLLSDWKPASYDGVYDRAEYTVDFNCTQEDSVRIYWDDPNSNHAMPYQRALAWVGGINRELDARDAAEARKARGGQPPEGPLTLVREIGFVNEMGICRASTEAIIFYGPQHCDGREEAQHATVEACEEYIKYIEHHAQVIRDYLANGRNRNTHEWSAR